MYLLNLINNMSFCTGSSEVIFNDLYFVKYLEFGTNKIKNEFQFFKTTFHLKTIVIRIDIAKTILSN